MRLVISPTTTFKMMADNRPSTACSAGAKASMPDEDLAYET
jgi:hypothetical protein